MDHVTLKTEVKAGENPAFPSGELATFLNILKLKTLFKIVILMCSIIDQMKAKRDIQI